MESYSVQIVESDSDNGITLNEKLLRSILTSDPVKDKYVSVISITGTFRQGKSFLLNFFLRFLRNKYFTRSDVTDWLKPEDGPVEGFSWASGSKRHTTGIIMWREIFFTKTPSGEKVAIILLDTQGTFDNQSSVDNCARIFALSTLISSVQIYNLMRSIKQYDLSHLQCFGGYGSLLSDTATAPFQNLWFLVRDWACPYEHPYGSVGGAGLLEEVFQTDQCEVKEQVQNIKQLFEKLNCFLMPPPGRVVELSQTFTGDLNEIDDDFKKHVQDFVPMLLSPENLVLKRVHGNFVKAEDLVCYIEEYCKILKEDRIPKTETIFQATVEAQHRTAYSQAFKLYKKNMDVDVKHNPRLDTNPAFYNKHAANKAKCVDYYTTLKKFKDETIFNKYLEILKKDVDAELEGYRTFNEEKNRRHEEQKRRHKEQKRQHEESQRRMQERIQASTSSGSGGGLSQMTTGEKVGAAAAAVTVIGGVAALAFGASKLFSKSSKNE